MLLVLKSRKKNLKIVTSRLEFNVAESKVNFSEKQLSKGHSFRQLSANSSTNTS